MEKIPKPPMTAAQKAYIVLIALCNILMFGSAAIILFNGILYEFKAAIIVFVVCYSLQKVAYEAQTHYENSTQSLPTQ
jgi:hypothetical protein